NDTMSRLDGSRFFITTVNRQPPNRPSHLHHALPISSSRSSTISRTSSNTSIGQNTHNTMDRFDGSRLARKTVNRQPPNRRRQDNRSGSFSSSRSSTISRTRSNTSIGQNTHNTMDRFE